MAAVFAHHKRDMPVMLRQGLYLAAVRSRTFLVRISPVYTGALKNAWRVAALMQGPRAASLINDVPYAGIIERGSRPHKLGRDAIAALREWVRKKITIIQVPSKKTGKVRVHPLTPKEAEGEFAYWVDEVLWAIVKHIEKYGTRGQFIVRNNLGRFAKFAREEVERLMKNYIEHPPGIGGGT